MNLEPTANANGSMLVVESKDQQPPNDVKGTPVIYHYTQVLHSPSILAEGLQPSALFIAPSQQPLLWFSMNPTWENTVLPFGAPSLQEAYCRTLDFARIKCGESEALYRWKELKELASIPHRVVSGLLYSSAIELGSRPGEWRATLDIVPGTNFMAIEFYDGEKWIPQFDSVNQSRVSDGHRLS